MANKRIFKDIQLQDEFDKFGVLKINFTSEHIMNVLLDAFHSFHSSSDELMNLGYYFSVFSPKKDYMLNIREKFYPILSPILEAHFHNYKVLSIILQIKGTNNNSAVSIHQDLTTVDEDNYGAATLWIPLNSSTLSNGAISFLKGSHKCFSGFRAHTADYYQFEHVEKYIFKHSKPYTTELGQALIFHPGTIHYSPKNSSNFPRLSIALSIVSKNATTQIGYLDKADLPWRMELYKVPDDFFYRYVNFNKERLERPQFGAFVGYLNKELVKSYELKSFQLAYSHFKENENYLINRFKIIFLNILTKMKLSKRNK
jgi:hypothetical protein